MTPKVEQSPRKRWHGMTREDTARHERTWQGTARHEKARTRGHGMFPTCSLHVRMPICTPGSSNTINDDESLRMPTKVSYGPNNIIHELLSMVKAPSCKTIESLRKIL